MLIPQKWHIEVWVITVFNGIYVLSLVYTYKTFIENKYKKQTIKLKNSYIVTFRIFVKIFKIEHLNIVNRNNIKLC